MKHRQGQEEAQPNIRGVQPTAQSQELLPHAAREERLNGHFQDQAQEDPARQEQQQSSQQRVFMSPWSQRLGEA